MTKSLLLSSATCAVLLYFILALSQLSSVRSIAVFASPYSTCTNITCDGSLFAPYTNIQAAMNAKLVGAVPNVVLLPGIYSGPGNVNVLHARKNLPVIGMGWDTTIIDCQNTSYAFNLSHGNYWLHGMTVQNCGFLGGWSALEATNIGLWLTNTKWINNKGTSGGAVGFAHGNIYTDGGQNEFWNNTASLNGGAVWLISATMQISGTEVFSGNSVNGNTTYGTANVGGKGPFIVPNTGVGPFPYSSPPAKLLPKVYVDPSASCGTPGVCSGNKTNPFQDLRAATIYLTSPSVGGGILYLAPGVYSGVNNTQITVNHTSSQFLPWPGRVGSPVIECGGNRWGLEFFVVTMTLSGITFQNCTTANPNGGGAVYFVNSTAYIYNTHFLTNSATVGSGGALTLDHGLSYLYGGSFSNNWAQLRGGAIEVAGGALLVYGGIFSNNSQNGTYIVDDIDCSGNSWVGTDGTLQFDTAGLGGGNCILRLVSLPAVAVFPGSMDAELFPVNAGGNVSNSFGGITFDSVVEVDSTGTAIASTRLSKNLLKWDQLVTGHANFTRVQYDAFGPAYQFVRIIHDFYNTTSQVVANNQVVTVAAGSVKTTIQLALWPFQSPSNSLAFIMKTSSSDPVTTVTLSPRPDGISGTLFTVVTGAVTLFFNTFSWAEYDPALTVKPVTTTTYTQGSDQYFQFLFSNFQSFVSFDPELSVILTTDNGGHNDDSTSTPVGLIIGLTVGLTVFLSLVVVVVIIAGLASTFFIHHQRRTRFETATSKLQKQEARSDVPDSDESL